MDELLVTARVIAATLAVTLVQPLVIVSAQAQEAFDVASIKLVDPPLPSHTVRLVVTPGRLTIDAAMVRQVIGLAYGIQRVRVVGGPAWIDSDQYNFAALQRVDASLDDTRTMLQHLIAERFGLAVHRETKDITVYRLVPDNGGTKIQAAKTADTTNVAIEQGHITYTRQPMLILVNMLANMLDAPVLDETGLQGSYNFALSITSDNGAPLSIFTAVREQLGLRLEADKRPTEVLVIDRISRPSPD